MIDNRIYKLCRVAIIHFCSSDKCKECYNLLDDDCDNALRFIGDIYQKAIKYEENEKC